MTIKQLRRALKNAVENGQVKEDDEVFIMLPNRQPLSVRPLTEYTASRGAMLATQTGHGNFVLAETEKVV